MFAVNGLALGSWLPRLPEVRDQLDVGDAALGLTLLGAGVGGLAMSLAAGRIVDRIGSRRAMVSTSIALALLLPGIAWAPSPGVLFGVLVAIGAVDGVTDVAQNSQALELQRHRQRSLLSRMHAAWSVGSLTGGVVASRAAAANVSLGTHLTVTAGGLALACLLAAPHLLPDETRAETRAAAADGRSARIGLLGLLFGVGVISVLTENPPMEWASLLVSQRFDVATGTAGLGFVAFTAGMVAGRLSGDRVVDRIGPEGTRRCGAATAAVGIACIAVSPGLSLALAGFVLAGVGASSQFPMAVRRAGELVAGSRGVARFSAGTRAGMLVGSPVMGVLSAATSRTTALVLVAGTAAVIAALLRLPDVPSSD
ncbi:MAG: MFS transporter [Acidimicrobiales bacterium]